MPVVLAILGIISAAAIWYYRVQAAKQAGGDLLDMANDVRLAARRFGFKRRTNVHPVDSIDDPRLAASGLVAAIAGMAGPLTKDHIDEMSRQFQSKFSVPRDEAVEIATFGRWIAEQCGTRSEAVRRLSKRLRTLAGAEAHQDLKAMIDGVATATGQTLSEDQADAKETITRHLTN